MSVVELNQIVKSFGPLRAVDGASFSVAPGEIFGLLGPNGAGKTTCIRVTLDIFKPDSGSVRVLGGAMTEAKKDRIGYMPEERGLYQDIQLEHCLLYLASLKGLSAAEARRRLEPLLQQFDLAAHRHKKLKELSKGMQQKAQLITTLVHRPELVIIDEPFSGLDPVNTQMVKDLLQDLRRQGVTIIMSTHQMNQVEELCDRLVLIHHGKVVLYGGLDEVRRPFAGHAVLVRSPQPLPALQGVLQTVEHNASLRLELAGGVSPQEVLRQLVQSGAPLEQFEIATPSLDEIFIKVVAGGNPAGENPGETAEAGSHA
jgi:ABC-2 type transport system ATP-binding protein